jgi:oxygen-independent coproporphyrinogen-3 oxidase
MPAIDSSALRSTSEVSFSVQPPLSLYVHIPWCVRKCPYCDFNSHELRAADDKDRHVRALEPQLEAQYVEALLRDLESALPQIWGRRVCCPHRRSIRFCQAYVRACSSIPARK